MGVAGTGGILKEAGQTCGKAEERARLKEGSGQEGWGTQSTGEGGPRRQIKREDWGLEGLGRVVP